MTTNTIDIKGAYTLTLCGSKI